MTLKKDMLKFGSLKLAKRLIKFADELDKIGMSKEADWIDRIIKMSKTSSVMDKKTRGFLNKKLCDDISTGNNRSYYNSVSEAFELIEEAFVSAKVVALQEDNTKFEGFFAGRTGKAEIEIASTESKNSNDMYVPFDNTILRLTWHKVENGKFEVIAYMS